MTPDQFAERLAVAESRRLRERPHGEAESWDDAVAAMPGGASGWSVDGDGAIIVKGDWEPERVEDLLRRLHPWRKGPWRIGPVAIDAEWRSDRKWDRIEPHLRWRDADVLDIGCGNGYYALRAAAAGAAGVIGVDPTLRFIRQFDAVTRPLRGDSRPPVRLFVADDGDLPDEPTFDITLTMGVLYHRPDPIGHLRRAAATLRNGGTLVVETLVVDGEVDTVFVPPGRYARMRNVWMLPSVTALRRWMERIGLSSVRCVDRTRTTTDEQRSTPWMRFESLNHCLDSSDARRTVEGHPAPERAVLIGHVGRS